MVYSICFDIFFGVSVDDVEPIFIDLTKEQFFKFIDEVSMYRTIVKEDSLTEHHVVTHYGYYNNCVYHSLGYISKERV